MEARSCALDMMEPRASLLSPMPSVDDMDTAANEMP